MCLNGRHKLLFRGQKTNVKPECLLSVKFHNDSAPSSTIIHENSCEKVSVRQNFDRGKKLRMKIIVEKGGGARFATHSW